MLQKYTLNLFLETVEDCLYISIIYIYFSAYFEELRRLRNYLKFSLTCQNKFKCFANIFDLIPITFTVFIK